MPYDKLLDDLNVGLRAFVDGAFTFPVGEELPLQRHPPKNRYVAEGVQPPGSLYLPFGHSVSVAGLSSLNTQTIRFLFTVLLVDGDIKTEIFDLLVPTAGTIATRLCKLGEGFLLSAYALRIGGTSQLGQLYAHALLAGDGDALISRQRVLLAGYVTGNRSISFPENEPRSCVDIEPRPRYITGADPGVGALFTTTVPTLILWELVGICFIVVTNAVVGTRRVRVEVSGPAGEFIQAGISATSQVASLTRQYTGGAGLVNATTGGTHISFPLVAELLLTGGSSITIDIENGGAGDNISQIALFVKERVDF